MLNKKIAPSEDEISVSRAMKATGVTAFDWWSNGGCVEAIYRAMERVRHAECTRNSGPAVSAHVIARSIAYEETGYDWSAPETSYCGGGYRIDREKLAARITTVINGATRTAHAATAPAFRDLGTALRMIRDAVEELGPVAACSVSHDQFEPRPIDDAEAIIAGILKIKERARLTRLLAAMREAGETACRCGDGFARVRRCTVGIPTDRRLPVRAALPGARRGRDPDVDRTGG
jgi:hypothetical protein